MPSSKPANLNPDIDPPKRTLGLMVKAMALANDATLKKDENSGEWRSVGDPTEGALVVAAAQVGFAKIRIRCAV